MAALICDVRFTSESGHLPRIGTEDFWAKR